MWPAIRKAFAPFLFLVPTLVYANQLKGDLHRVNTEISWLRTLHIFQHAKVSNPSPNNGLGMMISRLTAEPPYENVIADVTSWGSQFVVTLYVRGNWDDSDTILLQAISRHLAGEPNRPITPEMALKAVQSKTPIEEYLPNGKLEFDHIEARFGECPWKEGCYIAQINFMPP